MCPLYNTAIVRKSNVRQNSVGRPSSIVVHRVNNPHETTADDADVEIRRVCSLLESIAKQYPGDSPESLALQDAATAYILVHQRQSLSRAYQSLKAASGGELSEEMIATLRRRGIDPDEFEDDD